MQNLTITFIQSHLHWQQIDANLAMFEEKIWQIKEQTDLIILPEMFSTGFTMEAQPLAEPMNSKTFRWMKQMAAQTKAVITGSFIVREGQQFYNRLIWMRPDGSYSFYDKRHLFRMAAEEKIYTPGKSILIEELNGWKICPLICYDLRFPCWGRNKVTEDGCQAFDLLIFIANWPAVRINAWDILLQARAIENLAYVAGVNRTGNDGIGIAYNGHSAIISPKGDHQFLAGEAEDIFTINLNYEELASFRKKFPAYLDADAVEIKM